MGQNERAALKGKDQQSRRDPENAMKDILLSSFECCANRRWLILLWLFKQSREEAKPSFEFSRASDLDFVSNFNLVGITMFDV